MSTPLRWSFFIFLHLFLTVRDTLNNNIDRKRSQLSQLQRQLSELESNVHDLKSQKVKWFAENPSLEKTMVAVYFTAIPCDQNTVQ